MRVKRSLLIVVAVSLMAVLFAICFAPLLVASGLRWWVQRVAQREGLLVEIGKIEAPLLRPVIVHDLRFRTKEDAPFQIVGATSRVEAALNLRAIFTHAQRNVRWLNVEGLSLDIRRGRNAPAGALPAAWPILENLLADSFRFSNAQLHVEDRATTVDLRDALLTGSELEAGTFTAREVTIAAPLFHKTLTELRGATSWQESRLSLGAITLMPGLDLDTLMIDLAQIGASRLGLEVNVDAFGGKVRARVSSDDRGGKRTWDVAGNASGISLARMSDALEWSDRASGSLHASKFTFRGELADLGNATATVWAEVSGLTWRDRTADTVMVGASLYNREIQVEQLYLKQRDNQLTLSGGFGWPEESSFPALAEFRGDVSASINDLGEFARLFGWNPSDFAGTLAAQGSLDARDGKFGGQLSVSGNALVLFRSPIESLDLKLSLAESRLELTQFELHQKDDFLRAEGTIALTADRAYTLSAQCSVGDLANYRGFIPEGLLPVALGGSANAEWKGRGDKENDSGNLHFRGRELRDLDGVLAPFDAEIEADYSPDRIFFPQFHFWNPHADLAAFVTIAKDYFHLQDAHLTLNNHPRLQANVYLPVSTFYIRKGGAWLASLSADPFFDADLSLDALDLAEFSAAVKTKADMSGTAAGQIQLSGTPASLQGKSAFRLRDVALPGWPAISVEVEAGLSLGILNLKAEAVVRGSNAVKIRADIPFQLQKRAAIYALESDGPVSATLDCPTVFLAKLPGFISGGIFTRGILSANLNVSGSVDQPLLFGDLTLLDSQLLGGPEISGGVTFSGGSASINYFHWKQPDADLSARGQIEFYNPANLHVALWPGVALAPLVSGEENECVNAVVLQPLPSVAPFTGSVNQIDLRGNFSGAGWTISLTREPPNPDADNDPGVPNTFPLCRDGKTLSLGFVPALTP